MMAMVAVEHRTLCCTSIENSEDTIIMSGEQGSAAASADRLVTVATYTERNLFARRQMIDIAYLL